MRKGIFMEFETTTGSCTDVVFPVLFHCDEKYWPPTITLYGNPIQPTAYLYSKSSGGSADIEFIGESGPELIVFPAQGSKITDNKKHRCEYCRGNTLDDSRGNCSACGAGRD